MYRAGAFLGNDLRLGSSLVLSPGVGADYTRVNQSGYTEKTPTLNSLTVRKNDYDSFRLKAGLTASFRLNGKVDLEGRAFYRYETGDTRSAFATSIAASPDLVLVNRGEKRKRASGEIGAGLRYQISERAALAANYDLLVEDGYAAHRISATVGWSF